MSESAYYNRQLRLFKREFPVEAGWTGYEPAVQEYLGFYSLPTFLTERFPESIRKKVIVPRLSRRHDKPADFSHGTSSLRETDWTGDIELAWHGQAIHIRCLILVSGTVFSHTTFFIATRSRSALADLCRKVRDYNLEKLRADEAIKVIGGRDIKRPTACWNDLILPKGMVTDIKRSVETFFKPETKEKYVEWNLPYRRGFLFRGVPGSGKTLCIKIITAMMRQQAVVAYYPKGAMMEADLLRMAFDKAESLAPAILVLEDLDKLGRNLPISYVLNLLDGLESVEGLLVLATSNRPELLDEALLMRPSRFDRTWSFGLPENEQRLEFLKRHGRGKFNDGTLQEIATGAVGFSSAYLGEVFATALSLAIDEGRDVTDADLLRSFRMLRTQIKTAVEGQQMVGVASDGLGFRVKEHRPGLDRAMDLARKRRIDILLVHRFDRFARSSRHLLNTLSELQELKVDFVSFQESIDTTSAAGRMVFTMVSAIAEFERSLVVERVKAGLRRAVANGKKLGRPRVGVDEQAVRRLRSEGKSMEQIGRTLNISRNSVWRAISQNPVSA